jgi:hypothetical protein
MRVESMPRSTAVARLLALDSITSPCTNGEAPPTWCVASTARSTGCQSSMWPCSRSTTMCALLPRILRLRSLRKPPITDSVVVSAVQESVTASTESRLIAARKPLFLERRWRAATSASKPARSTVSRIGGMTRTNRRRTNSVVITCRSTGGASAPGSSDSGRAGRVAIAHAAATSNTASTTHHTRRRACSETRNQAAIAAPVATAALAVDTTTATATTATSSAGIWTPSPADNSRVADGWAAIAATVPLLTAWAAPALPSRIRRRRPGDRRCRRDCAITTATPNTHSSSKNAPVAAAAMRAVDRSSVAASSTASCCMPSASSAPNPSTANAA